MANRITQRAVGRVVIFKGFDGKDYTAHVERVSKGFATLLYYVNRPNGDREWVTAYINDPSRIVGV